MTANIEELEQSADPRAAIRRMYVDGKLDANTATRELLTLDSQRRAHRTPANDEAPAAGAGLIASRRARAPGFLGGPSPC